MGEAPLLRSLGLAPYEPTWRAMQRFTDERDESTQDEIWLVEHPPVFTLGLNASREHLLAPGDIPVVQIDRGGQVTYHGPGQLVIYPLLNLRRNRLGARDLVTALENAVNDLEPFQRINVCGYRDLTVTRLQDFCPAMDVAAAGARLTPHLLASLSVKSTSTHHRSLETA
jgi:lipoate-protein ligase B